MPDTDDDLYDDGAPTDSDSDDEFTKQYWKEQELKRCLKQKQERLQNIKSTVVVDADRKSLGTITATNKLLARYTYLSKRKK